MSFSLSLSFHTFFLFRSSPSFDPLFFLSFPLYFTFPSCKGSGCNFGLAHGTGEVEPNVASRIAAAAAERREKGAEKERAQHWKLQFNIFLLKENLASLVLFLPHSCLERREKLLSLLRVSTLNPHHKSTTSPTFGHKIRHEFFHLRHQIGEYTLIHLPS